MKSFAITISAYLLYAMIGLFPLAHSQNLISSSDSNRMETALSKLAYADDFEPGDFALLQSTPKDLVAMLSKRLQIANSTIEENRLLALLAYKIKQFESSVLQSDRKMAVDLIVKKCEESEGEILQERLLLIERLPSAEIDQMGERLRKSSNPKTKELATNFLERRKLNDAK